MSYKTILVCLSNKEEAERLIPVAAMVCRQFNAHLVGIHVVQTMEIHPSLSMQITAIAITELHAIQEQQAKEVKEVFEKLTNAEEFVSEWKQIETTNSESGDRIAEQACSADLVIMAQADPEHGAHSGQAIVQRQVIERSGRPTLIIPQYGNFEHIGKRVLIGWSGTNQCTRAVHDALPFCQQSSETRIFWVSGDDKYANARIERSGHEIAVALDRHGVKASVAHHPRTDIPIGDELLNEAADAGADLIIAGAYGHSRLYDFVIGATTSHLLKFMTVPVLLAN